MDTITLPKNTFNFLLKSHQEMGERILSIETIVNDIARDEITPSYNAKLDRISRSMDKGKGLSFKNTSQLKKWFRSL